MTNYTEGQTAVGPGGKRIIFRRGGWEPLPSNTPSDDNRDRIAMRAAGLPILDSFEDPVMRIADPKRRDITRGSMMSAAQKELTKSQPAVDMARSTLATLDEFDRLNREIKPTGGWKDAIAHTVSGAFGDGKLARMDQISNSMARLMRQPGEGAVSDYEGKLFKSMVGGTGVPSITNKAFSQAARALANRTADYHQFREAFVQANGHLTGADRMWTRYRDANPLIGKDGKVRQVPKASEWYGQRMRDTLANGIDPKTRAPRSAPPSLRKKPAVAGWTVKRIR